MTYTDHETVGPRTNQVHKFVGIQQLLQEERSVPTECGPDEVIVCPKFNGLCGSDMHIYLTGKVGPKPFERPFVLGHEASGVVHKVGKDVTTLQPGDRVALEPGIACRRCDFCKTGHYEHCEYMRFAAAAHLDGTLAGYYTLPADLCHKLPDNLSLAEGALMEPLAVGVNAVHRIAELRAAENVAVFGAGPVGLLTAAVAKALGARRIIIIDVQPARLDFAASHLGCDVHLSILKQPGETNEDYSTRHAAEIKSKFGLKDRGHDGLDVVFECSAQEVCAQTGMLILKRRGKYVQVGNAPPFASIPLGPIGYRELKVLGTFRYGPGIYWMAIDLVSRGLIDLKPLITHRYPFREAVRAFETTRDQKSEDGRIAIKVMIEGPVE